MKKSFLKVLAILLVVSLAACSGGSPATVAPNNGQVATMVSSTLAAMPTSQPAATSAPAASSKKLEDFPNKVFIGENDRFSVFVVNATSSNDPEYVGQIIVYNKGMQMVYEIVGTFKLLTNTIVFNDDEGKYLLLSVGTYTSRTAIVIALDDKKQAVNDFCIQSGESGAALFWQDYVIYNTCTTFTNRPWGAGEAPGVAAVNLKTGATTDIAKADLMHQFNVKAITGNTLQYVGTAVAAETDWQNPNSQTKTDMTYDLSTLGK